MNFLRICLLQAFFGLHGAAVQTLQEAVAAIDAQNAPYTYCGINSGKWCCWPENRECWYAPDGGAWYGPWNKLRKKLQATQGTSDDTKRALEEAANRDTQCAQVGGMFCASALAPTAMTLSSLHSLSTLSPATMVAALCCSFILGTTGTCGLRHGQGYYTEETLRELAKRELANTYPSLQVSPPPGTILMPQ